MTVILDDETGEELAKILGVNVRADNEEDSIYWRSKDTEEMEEIRAEITEQLD